MRRANMKRGRAGGRFVKARHRKATLDGNAPPTREPGHSTEMAALKIKPAQSQVTSQGIGVRREVKRVAHHDAARRVCGVEQSSEQLVEINGRLASNADLVVCRTQ